MLVFRHDPHPFCHTNGATRFVPHISAATLGGQAEPSQFFVASSKFNGCPTDLRKQPDQAELFR